MHLGDSGLLDDAQRPLERRVVLTGKSDDHVGRQVEPLCRFQPPEVAGRVVPTTHGVEHGVIARLERDMEMMRHGGCFPHRSEELGVHVVQLDGGQSQAGEPGVEPASRISRARR